MEAEASSATLPALIDGHVYHRQDSRHPEDTGVYRYDEATNTLVSIKSYWAGRNWATGSGFGLYHGEENFEVWTDVTKEVGGHYNWKWQPERLVYLGLFGNWHQFALVETPDIVWCEVSTEDLHMLEETKAPAV